MSYPTDKVRLREGGISDRAYLVPWDAQIDIRALRISKNDSSEGQRVFQLIPTTAPNHFHFRATDVVGTVSVGGFEIYVEPKAGYRNLAYYLNISAFGVDVVPDLIAQDFGDLREYLNEAFLLAFDEVMEVGLFESYEWITERGAQPKGQLKFDWRLMTNPGELTYRFMAYTSGNPVNAYIAMVLERVVATTTRRSATNAKAQSMRRGFAPQAFVGNATYEGAVELVDSGPLLRCLRIGRLIMEAAGVEPSEGTAPAPGMLFRMATVFEGFLERVAGKAASVCGVGADLQGADMPRYLGANQTLRLHPDFTIWDSGTCVLVGDAKYKTLTGAMPRADVYQAYSFAAGLSAQKALYFYVGQGQAQRFELLNQKTLIAHSLDLASKPGPDVFDEALRVIVDQIQS